MTLMSGKRRVYHFDPIYMFQKYTHLPTSPFMSERMRHIFSRYMCVLRTLAHVICLHPFTYWYDCYMTHALSLILFFQRIGQSLREGGPEELRLERFIEAVKDDETALSYHALIGTRKQSVSDVEQIFGEKVLRFFEKKHYTIEADYVRVVRNWRRACDERGLSPEQRRQFNHELVCYILDKLMPWHKQPGKDLSHLEVNQYVNYLALNPTYTRMCVSYDLCILTGI